MTITKIMGEKSYDNDFPLDSMTAKRKEKQKRRGQGAWYSKNCVTQELRAKHIKQMHLHGSYAKLLPQLSTSSFPVQSFFVFRPCNKKFPSERIVKLLYILVKHENFLKKT
jgi:hypothetical protein